MSPSYHIYILQNTTTDKLYIGYTGDLPQRLKQHYRGKSRYISNQPGQWKLLFHKPMRSKKTAISLERKLKRWKNKSGCSLGYSVKNLRKNYVAQLLRVLPT